MLRLIFIAFGFILFSCQISAQKKVITFEDIMKFKQIKTPRISENGSWVYYVEQPDRGDGTAVFINTDDESKFLFERGSNPEVLPSGDYALVTILPEFSKLESEEKDKPKNSLMIFNFKSGDTVSVIKDLKNYKYSKSSVWVAVQYTPAEKSDSVKNGKAKKEKEDNTAGSPLKLINLKSNETYDINYVNEYAFDSLSSYLAYTTADTTSKGSIEIFDLAALSGSIIDSSSAHNYNSISWSNKSELAFIKSALDMKKKPGAGELYLWDKDLVLCSRSDTTAGGWIIPSKNNLKWSVENDILFYGRRPYVKKDDEVKKDSVINIYDFEKILKKKTVSVWHADDPLIKTHEEKLYKSENDRNYTAAFHVDSKRTVQLGDSLVPDINITAYGKYAIGRSNLPYRKEITWDDNYNDFYRIDLNSGERVKLIDHFNQPFIVSPASRYAVYYKDSAWHKLDLEELRRENLTSKANSSFIDEDFDMPADVPGYGTGGWYMTDSAVIIYDKYDIWHFSLVSDYVKNLTAGEGRNSKNIFRVVNTQPLNYYVNQESGNLLLSAYNDEEKYSTLYRYNTDNGALQKLSDEKKKLSYTAKAKNSDKIIYTKETYSEFPDLWITRTDFKNQEKLTDLGRQTEQFYWGSSELIEWMSIDGIRLQGVVIKPENFKSGKKYPVLIYYYELFSQRLHEFPDMIVNHRPNFALYTSNDYVIFLPDIRYKDGFPGQSALNSMLPGVMKLIETGFADPDAIALHGHSWSGYQTAYLVTRTDIFKCAIAGAPVSNMTSAYSGIRWGTGLARQFQYEKAQSRIGASLWEKPFNYIENSPVFTADKINTPLLLMHGDEDDAVPWYQSIEMYLALRRLGKDVIFLQYKGEPHHPKKYANKLDYSIRMKEYLDYHLKGTAAPDWIKYGLPYSE